MEQDTLNKQGEGEELNLIDLLRIGLANWHWFALSVVVCLGLAVLYLKSTPYVFTRSASILIKDEMRGGALATEATAFADLDMLNVKSSVDNEMIVFKSKRLMTEVARRLRLDVSYKVKQGLRNVELYTQSPVILQFPDEMEMMAFALQVTPLSEKEVLLSEFVLDEELENPGIKVQLNDTVTTPIGRVVVTPTRYYTDSYYRVPVAVTKSNLFMTARACNNGLQVTLANKMASVIDLSLNDVSPTRAEDIINTLITVYTEDAINDKNKIAINTSNFINDRLIIIEKELGGVDAEIETYKKENRLTDIISETGMYLETASRTQQEGLGLENQLTLAQYIREYLTDPQRGTDLIPANTGISDINIEGQISEYNKLLLKRDKLIGNSSDRNPVVMDLNNSLDAMKQTIIRTIDNLINGLNVKISTIRAQETQTARRISAVPTQQKYVLSVERQQKIKEALYLYLLNKREENALSKSITESNARIIDEASGSYQPIAPKVDLILLGALVLGLVLPGGVLWLLSIMDTRVRSRHDVEKQLTVPFLGEIPLQDKEKGKKSFSMAVSENGRDAVSEAFRIVRTNMDFMQVDSGKVQVVIFTSLNPDAGKTYVSSNLAMSLALAGKRVVLIDLDIRKGTLSSHLGMPMKVGVTNYLSGRVVDRVDEIIQKSKFHPNLDVVVNGPVPPNPAELLLSKKLDSLIEELKALYDYVIVDNVPSNMIADAVIANRIADLTIYVIRAGAMDRRQLPEVEKLYQNRKFCNMAVLLNGVNYSRTGYGYGKYGYGKYGYGYGY